MIKKLLVSLLFMVGVALAVPTEAQACPGCPAVWVTPLCLNKKMIDVSWGGVWPYYNQPVSFDVYRNKQKVNSEPIAWTGEAEYHFVDTFILQPGQQYQYYIRALMADNTNKTYGPVYAVNGEGLNPCVPNMLSTSLNMLRL